MDYESIAKKILQRVGGKENVISLVHCMTRLRFTLKDESIVDDEAVKKTKGVMGIMKKAGQYQIIIGNDVANVYAELNKLGNFSNEVPKKAPQNKEKQNVFSMLMDTISGIMAPVIPAIIGAALVVDKVWDKDGVFNIEEFDPDPYMEALNKWGLPWVVDENPRTVE